MSLDDESIYCGTTSGDIVQLSLAHKVLKATGPEKNRFSQG